MKVPKNYHSHAQLGAIYVRKVFLQSDLVLHTISLKSMCSLTQEFTSIFPTEWLAVIT